MITVPAATERVLRADAARNRELVLEAASSLFREHGLDVTMQEIADAAGVGVGTVSRRFRSKDELIAALVGARIEHLFDVLERAVERAAFEPWEAFAEAFEQVVELHVRDRGFLEAVSERTQCAEACDSRAGEMLALVEQLVGAGIDAGVLRADLTAQQVPELACMVSHAGASVAGPAPSDAWRRACEVVLDGLRAR